MVTALLQLNHSLTPITPLPALILGLRQQLNRLLVFGTIPRAMPLAITSHTHLGLTLPTLPVLAVRVVGVVADVLGLDELVAALGRAVDAVAGRVLDELLVPRLFEVVVKKPVYMFQGDVVCGAAFGWHVLGVGEGQFEASLEAVLTHPVAAFEPCRLFGREIVHAYDAIDTGYRIRYFCCRVCPPRR